MIVLAFPAWPLGVFELQHGDGQGGHRQGQAELTRTASPADLLLACHEDQSYARPSSQLHPLVMEQQVGDAAHVHMGGRDGLIREVTVAYTTS
jgi:hypothetical protein